MIQYFERLWKYLIASMLALALFAHSANALAWHIVILYSFKGGADGRYPSGGLTPDGAGNLYGPTDSGGGSGCKGSGCGTIFALAPDGTEAVRYAFKDAPRGHGPGGKLIADKAGNLYGTTILGGVPCQGTGTISCGTVFKVSPLGVETKLYSFRGLKYGDGGLPHGRLVMDKAGNLYGTTNEGGDKAGCGTVLKLSPNLTETVLHSFAGIYGGGDDGCNPDAGLLMDKLGNVYGTTYGGGGYGNYGTVFKLAADGSETVLHAFAGFSDGQWPGGNLMADGTGALYGTTSGGGSTGCGGMGCGTIFKLAADGTETVLYAFAGGSDGEIPYSSLRADMSGNLYGTTLIGGSANMGTVFELAPDGTETVLYAFTGANGDGALPNGTLIADEAGNLYGTTNFGGADGDGAVFELVQ